MSEIVAGTRAVTARQTAVTRSTTIRSATTRPVMVGIAGDSGAGKTTLVRGLVTLLGTEQATYVPTDGYHRDDRRQRAERGLTPLHPDANHVGVPERQLTHLRAGEAILNPAYDHRDGTF